MIVCVDTELIFLAGIMEIVANETGQKGPSHPPLLRQRVLLSSAPVGLQPDELVQADLSAARVSACHTAAHTPADPLDARTDVPHPQPPMLGHVRQRTRGGGLELRLTPNHESSSHKIIFFHAGFRFNSSNST